jgi:hypothetical protein
MQPHLSIPPTRSHNPPFLYLPACNTRTIYSVCVLFPYLPISMRKSSTTPSVISDSTGSDFDIFSVLTTEGKNSSTWQSDIGPDPIRMASSSGDAHITACIDSQHKTRLSRLPQGPIPKRSSHKQQRLQDWRSHDELQSRYHSSLMTAAVLRDELNVRKLYLGLPSDSTRLQAVFQAMEGANASSIRGGDASLRRYARRMSLSDPELRRSIDLPRHHPPSVPLKTCLKHKAESTAEAPFPEITGPAITPEDPTLRRTKIVDFEEAKEPKPDPPTTIDAPKKMVHIADEQTCRQPPRFPQSRKHARRIPSYYSTTNKLKATPAGPATTRADVHVVANTPLRRAGDAATDESFTATPTRQIVESKSGSHQTIWNNIPPEPTNPTANRNSSASNYLQAFSPATTHNLQRINTKLTDWSGSRLTDWVGT